MLGDLIREHTRDAAPIDGRGHRATDAVDHQPGRELDCSWDGGAWQRRKAPGVGAKIGKCDDLVLGQITRLLNARMLRQVTRCSRRHHPANFADREAAIPLLGEWRSRVATPLTCIGGRSGTKRWPFRID